MLSYIETTAKGGPAGDCGDWRKNETKMFGREYPLAISLLSSVIVHVILFSLPAIAIQQTHPRRQDPLAVSLIEMAPIETASSRKLALPLEFKGPPATPPTQIPVREEPAKSVEPKSAAPAKAEVPTIPAPTARVEGGGSEAGAGNLFGKGDVGVVPGPGTAGGGGGTAASGLGRGSGAPGLPAQPVLRTNREAKPIQTVRANYPPMALRMGMESDVTLKIEVDPEGKVIKAEITKSGGAGFDDEALKAVKQSRFEPAQKEGKSAAAEFAYIYRFRLQR